MKHTILKFAVSIMCFAIRRYGWTYDPKPHPYKDDSRFPWWRRTSATHIETNNFAGAIHQCVKEMMAEEQPVLTFTKNQETSKP